jgi:hypothetical protein
MIQAEGLVRDENFRPIDGNFFLDNYVYSIYLFFSCYSHRFTW